MMIAKAVPTAAATVTAVVGPRKSKLQVVLCGSEHSREVELVHCVVRQDAGASADVGRVSVRSRKGFF